MTIVYRSPKSGKEFEEYFTFRWELLRKPLGLERGSEQDELEKSAFHIAAYINHTVIGVGRLHIEANTTARIRYMAVHDDYQNQGVGSYILKELEQFALVNNIQTCWLYARERAVDFYINNGFEIKGENKSELSQLRHQRMEKSLV